MTAEVDSRTFEIVASAGTYHLPFDRLFEWLLPWVELNAPIHVIAQHGVSSPMNGADNFAMIEPALLLEMYRDADVVILQGGAGGVMDARTAQRIPILVPRVPGEGEVIDYHQVQFTRKLASMGLVYPAERREELWQLLDRAYQGNLVTRQQGTSPTPGASNAMRLLKQLPDRLSWQTRARRLATSVKLFVPK